MREPHYEFHCTDLEDNVTTGKVPLRASCSSEISSNPGRAPLPAKDVLWQNAIHLVQNPNWLWESLGHTMRTPKANLNGMEIHFPRLKLQRQNANMANGDFSPASPVGPWLGFNLSGNASFYASSDNNSENVSSSGTSALLRNAYKWRKRHGCLDNSSKKVDLLIA